MSRPSAPAAQLHTCNCMQKSEATHADDEQAASSASSASSSSPSVARSALVRTIPVGPLGCNMTVIADAETRHALLIDPGGDAEAILSLVAEMDVHIKLIVVTHAHIDHVLASEAVRKATGAPLALHPADRPLWSALPLQMAMLGLIAGAGGATDKAAAPSWKDPDVDLSDGLALPVRGGRVLHTPGHSPGSCCFYFPSDSLLCSGDTLFKLSVGRSDLMGGDARTLKDSIQRQLYSLPGHTEVIPGHGPQTSIAFESKHNPFVRASTATAEKAAGAVAKTLQASL